jgi:hypothetical protein
MIVTKTILALALLVVATPALAAPDYRSPTGTRVLVKLASYSENAGTCAKPSVFKITLEATNFSFAVGEYRETVPVAADGSFDKVVKTFAGGSTSTTGYRMWGNVKTHEFHTQGAQGLCRYDGSSWEVQP